ncbi:hypothetical protein GH741_08665 [Aquibacillus halophilus]|uniref:Uncharacterized protein n=1 Tax=Aquibacillus halophilus TaxID=930132 RepID=A0A6A8DFX8_9BACI|nr:hypothetical protein [Aquibacillus halophilus]
MIKEGAQIVMGEELNRYHMNISIIALSSARAVKAQDYFLTGLDSN